MNYLKYLAAVIFVSSFTLSANADIKTYYGGYTLNYGDNVTPKEYKNELKQFKNGVYNKCEDFYVKKNGAAWELIKASKSALEDKNIEILEGCIKLDGGPNGTMTAVEFKLKLDALCTVKTICHMRLQSLSYGIEQHKGCQAGYEKITSYEKYDVKRSAGYFACNSNFVKKGFWGIDYDDPILHSAAAEIVKNGDVKLAAKELVLKAQNELLSRINDINSLNCSNCQSEADDINVYVRRYYHLASKEQLESLSVKWLQLSGYKELPENFGDALSPESIHSVNTKSEQLWRERYRSQANNIFGINPKRADVEAFIRQKSSTVLDNWRNTDFDGLLSKAREVLIGIEQREKSEAQAAQKQILLAEERRHQAAALERQAAALERQRIEARESEWRKTLKIGDDTFCGRVIEIKKPMVKIAVSAQLPGYTNEAWLKMEELFPPTYGCRNTNGKLSHY